MCEKKSFKFLLYNIHSEEENEYYEILLFRGYRGGIEISTDMNVRVRKIKIWHNN